MLFWFIGINSKLCFLIALMLNVYELNSGRIEQKLIFNLVKIIFSQEQCNPMDYEELLIKKSLVDVSMQLYVILVDIRLFSTRHVRCRCLFLHYVLNMKRNEKKDIRLTMKEMIILKVLKRLICHPILRCPFQN